MSSKRKSKGPKAPTKKKAAAKKPAKKAAARKAAPPRAAAPKKPSGPQIIHWEIQSQQPNALHKFYADAFGWKIDANNPMNYGMVTSGGGEGGINGGIGGSPVPGSRVVVYTSVASIPTALEKIEALGGKATMPRTELGMVTIGMYLDPEGNLMGLVETMM